MVLIERRAEPEPMTFHLPLVTAIALTRFQESCPSTWISINHLSGNTWLWILLGSCNGEALHVPQKKTTGPTHCGKGLRKGDFLSSNLFKIAMNCAAT